MAPPPTPVHRRAIGGQSGQTLAIFVVFMMAVLGMAAFAIDAGTWYQDRRHLQADADAAALAGAANFTLGTASSTAQANFNKNKLSGETATVTTPAYDTIKVTTNYSAPTFFSKVFGRNSAALSATATARIQGLGGVKNHVSPYVVTEASYANGTGTTLFNCDASGQCGTVDLPTTANTTGGSCSGPVYTGITGNVQAALAGTNTIGEVDIGGCLSPKTGNAQPSANTVNNLAGSMAQDLQSLGNGQYQIIPQAWDDANGIPPRLIFVPIVPAFATGTNATMVVSNFAWFYMTGATGNGNGLRINGVYVSVTMPPLSGGSTAWVPGRVGQVTFVSLTG